MEKLKALLHIDELEKWPLLLGNGKNLLGDVGAENISLEIVVNGVAVQLFAPRPEESKQERKGLHQQLGDLSEKNVKILVCRNALRANSISEEGLPAFITVVPAGITRIVRQQLVGYAYVKP